jgi:hypothetical protein
MKNSKGYATMFVTGEFLLVMAESDGTGLDKDLYVSATGYVNEISEFPYSNNTKKALKLRIDFDGISIGESVLWPDYDTGELIYDREIKKGSIVTVFFRKKMNRKDMNIQEIVLESIPKKKKLTSKKNEDKVEE